MKIGLFTIFRCLNYGAVLQAIALESVLMRLFPNAKVEIINHLMDSRDNHLLGKITNPNTPWFQRWRNKRKFSKRYFKPELFEHRREKTIALIEKMLSLSARLYEDPEELLELERYDTVVVGSDQVWNPILNHDFPTNQYLCSTFPEEQKRVSYAASFGVKDLPSQSFAKYRSALNKFSKITVREETGSEIIFNLLGFRPQVVLDPTMLMTTEEWKSLLSSANCADTPSWRSKPAYVFAYWVRTIMQEDVDALSQLAKRKNCDILLTVAGQLPKLNFASNVIPCLDADPADWVHLLSNSSAVVTDSFHGLQFAMNFSKPVISLGELKNTKSRVSRLVDFCVRYGVRNACRDIEEFRRGADMTLVDGFDSQKLKDDRERCISILKDMINV